MHVLSRDVLNALLAVVGAPHVRVDDESLRAYGTDALKRGRPADAEVLPASAREIAAVVRLCADRRIPQPSPP